MARAIQCDRCDRFLGFQIQHPVQATQGESCGWKAIRIGDDSYRNPGYNGDLTPILCPLCLRLHSDFMLNKSVLSSPKIMQVEYTPTTEHEHASEPDATGV